ncbi:unnamed protein product [Meganyctiphanes norvegica]|uniref:Uncharacterized protein n=1 Tax=Meganyctiphanes norvegica TaxID=48144 RepID=A0AAV2PSP7_MEGNR
MSGMQSSMSAYMDELKAVLTNSNMLALAEVATKEDLQILHSKQVEMALAQVATDDQLANSTMLLQMELQQIKDQLAHNNDLQLVKEAVETSTSIFKKELYQVKSELAELKKKCNGCHTADQKVCVYKDENYSVGSFNVGCSERCECFANGTTICQNRCDPPHVSVGSYTLNTSCTETPSDSDKCCVIVSCNTTLLSFKIHLNESNIAKHSGFSPGGAGPVNLLHGNGFWNPNPAPWYVIFDFHRLYMVGGMKLSNFGDVTHDVAQFTLETADSIDTTYGYRLVTRATNVGKGTNDPQLFTFSPATGRYWRFNVTNTYTDLQPWVEELTFHGQPAKERTCPTQFRKLGEQCLRVFLGPAEDRTYHQALSRCQYLGGTLAQLQDTSHIIRHISTDLGKGNWKFWVGATFKNKKEGFRWLTSGKKVTNWDDGQPDNGGLNVFDFSDEHCVEIQAWNAKYNDQDCDEKRSFICQIDPMVTESIEEEVNSSQLGQVEQEVNDRNEQQEQSISVTWRNCDDVREYMLLHIESPPSAIRQIFPYEDNKNKGVLVSCDLITYGGGWTLIQHRDDYDSGLMDFNKLWQDYKDGFGDVEKDHWLGLDKIYALTHQGPTELLIMLENFRRETAWAHYDHFVVHSEATRYTLEVSGYTGNAGDSFTYQSGEKFTTIDVDNDQAEANCAYKFGGAWWHKSCHESNLNGRYLRGTHISYADGIEWKTWHGYNYSLKGTTMMIRPRRDTQDDQQQQGVIQIEAL